jgi:hypothetical protein
MGTLQMTAMYNSGPEQEDPAITVIKPGVTVAYRLLPKDMPINPNKIWLGKVLYCKGHIVLVELLEHGFQNLREHITYQQIVGVS